jgi:GntR family transcriptional regulator of arabinose operon
MGDGMPQNSKPLYSKIYDDLKLKIDTGEYAEEHQLPTEIELADMYGVSRITSKRALLELERENYIYRKRGSGSYVKRRQRITSDTSHSGKIISIILPYVADNGLLGYIQGASEYLDTRGYYLTVHTSNWDKDKEKEFLLTLPRRGISGIILYPVSTLKNLETVYSLHMNQYSVITIDQYYDNVPVGSVVSNNFEGGYMAATKLLEMGHRRIAFVSSVGIEYRSSVRDRFYGYCQALRNAGISIESELVIHGFHEKYEHPDGKGHIRSVIQQLLKADVTAIQTEHDHLAVDLLRTAIDQGVRVPEELSIVGFDNHDISKNVEVPITTIAQNFYEIGRTAAEMIVDHVERGATQGQRLEVPVEWIERQTASPLVTKPKPTQR